MGTILSRISKFIPSRSNNQKETRQNVKSPRRAGWKLENVRKFAIRAKKLPVYHHCSVCDASFKREAVLLAHLKIHGIERKQFKCDDCSKQFLRKKSLQLHQKVHGKLPSYHCDVCGLNFATFVRLKAHGVRHAGQRPYACVFCKKKYQKFDAFIKHSHTHDGPVDSSFHSQSEVTD